MNVLSKVLSENQGLAYNSVTCPISYTTILKISVYLKFNNEQSIIGFMNITMSTTVTSNYHHHFFTGTTLSVNWSSFFISPSLPLFASPPVSALVGIVFL